MFRSNFHRRIFQYLATIGVNLGMISLGMHYGWSSTSLNILTSGNYTFTIDNDTASWLASILPIGAGIGAIFAAFTTNILGRKFIVSITIVPLAIGWILIALAPSVSYMFVGRFIAGLSDGMLFTSAPSYLAEISEPEIRGFLGATYAVTIVFGMLLMNIIQYYLPMEISAYIGAAMSLLMLGILPFVPDSAYFYLLRGKHDEAKASLQKFTGKGEVEEELKRMSEGVNKELKNGGKLSDLVCDSTNRKALILSSLLCILTQLIGITAIMSFATTVFESSKNFLAPQISNIIYFVVYFVASTVSLFFVDVSGRKFLMILSSLGSTFALFGTGAYLLIQDKTDVDLTGVEYIQVLLILLYTIFFSVGLQTIPTLLCSELFSSNVKGVGLCVTNITYSISVTICLKFFSWGSDTFGMYVPFFFYAIMAIAMIIFVVVFVPETKGKTLENIQLDLERTKMWKKTKEVYVVENK